VEGGREFEEVVSFRLFNTVREDVRKAVAQNPAAYENESHFYRVAVMKLLRTTHNHADSNASGRGNNNG
jgi:hypothetical protein